MNDNGSPLVVWLWMILATLGGAASSISFRPYKDMTWRDILLAFTVSATFSLFVGSLVAEFVARWLYGPGPVNLRVFGAVMWFMAAAAHFLIPVGISRVKRAISVIGETEIGK